MRRGWPWLVLAACADAPDQRLAIVRAPRILAVVAEPAEARPMQEVSYRALVAGPDGTIATDLAWAQCLSPKPPTEDNAVSAACIAGGMFADLGVAATVRAPLPVDACALHGPGVPNGEFRPRDADPSGGYYQPVRAEVVGSELLAFGLSRITCKLPTAPFELAQRYDREYVANRNPSIVATSPAGPTATVAAGADVELSVTWGETDAEAYLYFDTLARELVVRREAMRVSWFATGGEIDVDATAVAEGDDRRTVSTTWRAPAAPGPATLWFVLRDSRGGIATSAIDVAVQ
ncbi:MAG: hypothetical protein KF773_02940 [Deltaproteobacteria bacterium]|nr:hypothetical protein [Deltaproteobacteria bacterium]